MRLSHVVKLTGLVLGASAAFGAAASGATVTQLVAGFGHNCVLESDATIKCWGANESGQLGQADTNARGASAGTMGAALLPVNLGTGRTAVAVAVGDHFSCAILDNHAVKCWGANESGELGLGDAVNRGDQANSMGDALLPLNLGTGRTALDIALGSNHACAILDDHSLKCWGLNDNGQIGQGDANNRGDQPNSMGDALTPVNLGAGRSAKVLAVAGSNTCVILDNNALKCFGINGSGQLGLGDTNSRGGDPTQLGDGLAAIDFGTPRVKPLTVTIGNSTICAMVSDGSVRCWGDDSNGLLGTAAGQGCFGCNRGDAPNEMGANLPPMNLAPGLPVKDVQCGVSCCALFDNNAIKCWGANDLGELGAGDLAYRGVVADQMGDQLPFVELGHFAEVSKMTIGTDHTCVLLVGGSVKCWGDGQAGQLGYEDQNNRGGNNGDMGDKLPAVAL